jgi:hypothetical protein
MERPGRQAEFDRTMKNPGFYADPRVGGTHAFHEEMDGIVKEGTCVPMTIRMAGLLAAAWLVFLSGCAAPRAYNEGILAASDTFMSTEELRSYSLKIDQEIDRVDRGGAVPAGVSRDVYLEDLKSRQKGVQTRIMMAEHLEQKEAFEDKYPSP